MRLVTIIFCFLSLPGMVFAEGDPVAGKTKVALCAGCHGIDGNSTSTDYPKLASQGEAYLIKQITDFKTGARVEEYMSPMVETVKTEDIADIAAYFSNLPLKHDANKKADDGPGEQIYTNGIADKGIAACASCHGPKGQGLSIAKFPSVAGQFREYVSKMLKDFRSGVRKNDPEKMMQNIASKLSDSEIASLSAYISTLK